MSPGNAISSKISRIVRIRQMLCRWRKKAALSSSLPPDVPSGHVAINVGIGTSSRRRFVVPARYLNHPVFKRLLVEAEEEYGFAHQGPLMIPCDVSVFEEALRFVSLADSKSHGESSSSAAVLQHVSFDEFQSCSLERRRRINHHLDYQFTESRPLIGGAGSQ
ncbi:OLC1v1003382C1 [Oldenlandia corymbosa var. corymbosa]|uniref:OLC1v1003382C1 n=1 Tax=Oldenlandia corymbosa var. corymbosa TaxID=529605 RepID=A0AAV1D9X0_OLDCO|nr:OLC1v1003382C1 [Oldenlandia corymbosa var. corymbosa]